MRCNTDEMASLHSSHFDPRTHRAEARERSKSLPSPKGTADRVAFALALWSGCGRAPYAPGPAGSLGALPIYWAVTRGVRAAARGPTLAATAAALTLVGIWASGRVARAAKVEDPQ